jgi:hypothetical protein
VSKLTTNRFGGIACILGGTLWILGVTSYRFGEPDLDINDMIFFTSATFMTVGLLSLQLRSGVLGKITSMLTIIWAIATLMGDVPIIL